MARNRLIALFMALACLGFVACAEEVPQEVVDTGGEAPETPVESQEPAEDEGALEEAFDNKDCMKIAGAMSGVMGGMGAGGDIGNKFDEAISGLRRAGDFAPEEVQDDFAVFADAMAEYLTILKEAGIDFNNPGSFSTPEAQKAVQKATAVLEAPEVKEAQQNIDRVMTDLCGTQ